MKSAPLPPLIRQLWHDEAMTQLHTLVAYVPRTHTQAVLAAIGDAGAGRIGNYSHCSFVTAGTGRFTALDGAAPFIGDSNRATEVAEDRIECVVGGGSARRRSAGPARRPPL